jgi:hypothetical protein
MLTESFRKVYLDEAPQHLDTGGSSFDILQMQIQEVVNNKQPVNLSGNKFTVSDHDVSYYWFGTADGSRIDVAVTLDQVSPGTAVVELSAKNPSLSGGPPYASDLYVAAANHLGKKIRFTSGKILSADGLKTWRQLFKDKHVLSVYDNRSDKYAVSQINSPEELENFWGEHPDYQRYQYVLSEASGAAFIAGDFALMEWKRLAGWLS